MMHLETNASSLIVPTTLPNIFIADETVAIMSDINQKIEIYSIAGQLIKSLLMQESKLEIKLNKGIYIIKCDSFIEKIII